MTKAISVNAYWAWAIREGYKRVENRTWRTSHRGPLMIHAAKSDEGDAAAIRFLTRALKRCPPRSEIEQLRGRLVAHCELVDCFDHCPLLDRDPWACGPICWQLDQVEPIDPGVPCRGLPGVFQVDDGSVALRPRAR